MHFEILVEDASGRILLEGVLPRILGPLGDPHSWRLHGYKGIGKVPPDLVPGSDADKRILLDQLPRLLRGYGRSLQGMDAAVVVVVDQDRRDCEDLKAELRALLARCAPAPRTLFRIAVEEMESWLLGDETALRRQYPRCRAKALESYVQDAVCGTWEVLADAIHPGGSRELVRLGWPHVGQAKCEWARRLGPELDADGNRSKSFQVFRDGLRRLAAGG